MIRLVLVRRIEYHPVCEWGKIYKAYYSDHYNDYTITIHGQEDFYSVNSFERIDEKTLTTRECKRITRQIEKQ